jgi:hypothetical protein
MAGAVLGAAAGDVDGVVEHDGSRKGTWGEQWLQRHPGVAVEREHVGQHLVCRR